MNPIDQLLQSPPATRQAIAQCIRTMARQKPEPFQLELPYNPDPKKTRRVTDMIMRGASKENADLHEAMNRFLDWLLDIFDSSRFASQTFFPHLQECATDNPDWYEVLCRWNHDVRRGKTIDFFGEVYESDFKSGSKANRLGQFFTPTSISNLCAELTLGGQPEPPTLTFLDCACGSGRMLLGGYTAYREYIDNDTKFHFFMGGDVDHSSVKMCALNLMILGLQGIVINQDALVLDKPKYGYLINPTNAPVRSGILSVQYLDSDTCAQFVDWQDADGTHSNFGKLMSYYKWQWDIAHDLTPSSAPPPPAPAPPSPPKPTRAVQLTLFDDEEFAE